MTTPLSSAEVSLYSTLTMKSAQYVPQDLTQCDELAHSYPWMETRVNELWQHHMILDIWKPRFIRAMNANFSKGYSTK